MSERVRNFSDNRYQNTNSKMGPDIGPKKTMIVVVIVVGCFAVLWPKVFHPMFFGNAEEYMKPSAIDKSNGCCDVYSEKDMTTIKIMSELCSSIIKTSSGSGRPPSVTEIVQSCRTEVLRTCGIDIAAVLQEKIRLGGTVKQIINEVRSLNGSLCLRDNFGLAPWRLGVPHKVTTDYKTISVRQERPPHLRAEMMHPAFRERGAAIPRSPTPKGSGARIVEGRPGPIPGMRPPMGGAGHVVPPSQKGSSMGIIMPIYTIGIVIFFTYTLMKLVFKNKQPEGAGGPLYPPVEPDRDFRRDVFESERATQRVSRDAASKLVVNAMSALLDEVDEELEARRKANEVTNQAEANGISNGSAKHHKPEQQSVKVMGMETTESCEVGTKWHQTTVRTVTPPPLEIVEPPQEIFLEGALPAQSQILVSDAKTDTEQISDNDDNAIVLAGKMTLSVISMEPQGTSDRIEDEDIDSKYTTASGATGAEQDISDEADTDGEQEEDLLEDIEVAEE